MLRKDETCISHLHILKEGFSEPLLAASYLKKPFFQIIMYRFELLQPKGAFSSHRFKVFCNGRWKISESRKGAFSSLFWLIPAFSEEQISPQKISQKEAPYICVTEIQLKYTFKNE